MKRRNGARVKKGVWKGWRRVCSCFRLMKRIDSEMDWLEVARKQNEFNLDGLIAAVAAFHLHFLGSSLLVLFFFAAEQSLNFPRRSLCFRLCTLEPYTFFLSCLRATGLFFWEGCETEYYLIKGTNE